MDTADDQDFSEDIYRTLTAVDSAVMVLDAAAKGTDGASRSRPFEVCRCARSTSVDELDRGGRGDSVAMFATIICRIRMASSCR